MFPLSYTRGVLTIAAVGSMFCGLMGPLVLKKLLLLSGGLPLFYSVACCGSEFEAVPPSFDGGLVVDLVALSADLTPMP